jgi:hypothetical protein
MSCGVVGIIFSELTWDTIVYQFVKEPILAISGPASLLTTLGELYIFSQIVHAR